VVRKLRVKEFVELLLDSNLVRHAKMRKRKEAKRKQKGSGKYWCRSPLVNARRLWKMEQNRPRYLVFLQKALSKSTEFSTGMETTIPLRMFRQVQWLKRKVQKLKKPGLFEEQHNC
jgi:hypothetical protein